MARGGSSRPASVRWSGLPSLLGLLSAAGLLFACGGDDERGGVGPQPRSGADVAATGARPNLIIVSIDTLRADHLTTYGYARATSPHIDRLAGESVVFENAYSQSPRTAPSHMTVFTGLYPDAHGLRNWSKFENQRISTDLPTLASVLRQAGYRTEAYTGGGNVRAELGFDQGFEVYETVTAAVPTFERGAQALRALAGRAPGAPPFFLFLHTYGVHGPYTPPPGYGERFADPAYDGGVLSTPEALRQAAGSDRYDDLARVYWQHVDAARPADVARVRDLYDGAIALTDERLGAFLAELSRLGLRDDTLLVLLSDHGEEFQEHGQFQHSSVFQECLHVPLLFRFPAAESRIRPGRIAAIARLVDVTPTLLGYLGVPFPAELQGLSLLPLMLGERAPPREVFSMWRERDAEMYALRIDSWKYIHHPNYKALFDLEGDPAESANRVEQEPKRRRALLGRMNRLRDQSRGIAKKLESGRAPVQLSDETRRELEALGYLDGEGGGE